MAEQYVESYRRYCWPVNSVADLKVAPFHFLAAEGKAFWTRDHLWHMETLAKLCSGGAGLLLATPYMTVDITDATSEASATKWWEDLTEAGGEGMVVKSIDFIAKGRQGIA